MSRDGMDASRSLSGASGGDSRYMRGSEILSLLGGSKTGQAPIATSAGNIGPGRNVAPFDPSEFPSLGGRQGGLLNSSSTMALGSGSGLPLSMASVPMQQGSRSLGGLSDGFYSDSFSGSRSSNLGASGLGTIPIPSVQSVSQAQSNPFTQAVHQQNPFTQAVQQQQQLQHTQLNATRHDMALAGTHGLMGLMGVIRMEDPDRGSLALGTDLTTLGLNLNSSESLHTVFSGPWDDSPRDTLFALPPSYPKKMTVRPEIMDKVSLETLFVCFYSMPRDVMQILAAQELGSRGWRFHEELRLWFFQAKNGSTVFFDVNAWERRGFSGRFPEGFEAGFVAPDAISTAARQALNQMQHTRMGN